jgi:hypothetical protein
MYKSSGLETVKLTLDFKPPHHELIKPKQD